MLKIDLKKDCNININTNVEYFGCIEKVDHDEENEKLRVYVCIPEFPEEMFYQSFKVDTAPNSYFSKFCYKMNLVDEEGYVNVDKLHKSEVIVSLKIYSGKIYVRYMRYATEQEKEEYRNGSNFEVPMCADVDWKEVDDFESEVFR